MDREFDTRWRTASAPFDGKTVYPEDFVSLADLHRLLIPIVDLFYVRDPDAHLFRLTDWHEHDGWIQEATPTSWQELRSLSVSEDALAALCSGDTCVRTGFFTERRDFLLRLYVPDASDNPLQSPDDPRLVQHGVFDVTSDDTLATQVTDVLLAVGVTPVLTKSAKAYFDRNYGG